MIKGLKKFTKMDNTGFNYKARGSLDAGDVVILPFPKVTANRRGINDIGWQIDGDAKLYATLSDHPEDERTIWQEIRPDEGINKTAFAVKIVGGSGKSHIYMRIILN